MLASRCSMDGSYPNTALPYLVVVADGNGAVAEDPNSVNSTIPNLCIGGRDSRPGASASGATPAWETSMASDLMTIDHYDNVIAFNGERQFDPCPGTGDESRRCPLQPTYPSAAALNQNHAGDVVISISSAIAARVVVSRPCRLANQPVTALTASYVKVTLLDPHPRMSLTRLV